jgi:hypothetical protein
LDLYIRVIPTYKMTDIETLIKENRTNHYKLLTIVGNNKSRIDGLVAHLKSKDWTVYDVEEKVLKITEDIPADKIRLRIGSELKKWIKNVEDRIVLVNSNILYSEEMDKIGPFSAFKYSMRGDKEGVLFMEAKLRGDVAIYSTPDRPDYNERELSDVLFIELDNVEVPEV